MKIMKIMKMDSRAPLPALLEPVVARLQSGAVVVLPTDTVYGIAVAAIPQNTPERIYAIKGRDESKAIACLISGLEDLANYGEDVPSYAFTIAKRHWPGALTLVVKASPQIPPAFTAADGSIALRAPAHPLALAILRALDAPLATSSANLAGEPPALCVKELSPALASGADLIIDGGGAPGQVPSTVVSCLGASPKILREGAITAAALLLK